jgi:ABC-2 type transport system permease protein
VNWQHFRTFVWLQWRIRQNQLRRGGLANVIVLAVLAVIGAVIAVCGFLAAHLIGMFVLATVEPAVVMLVWDLVAIAFLFFWLIGLVHDLQRS